MANATARQAQNNNRNNNQRQSGNNRDTAQNRYVNGTAGQGQGGGANARPEEKKKLSPKFRAMIYDFFQMFSDFEDDPIAVRKREIRRRKEAAIRRRNELIARRDALRAARLERESAQKTQAEGQAKQEEQKASEEQKAPEGQAQQPRVTADQINVDALMQEFDGMLAELEKNRQPANEAQNEEKNGEKNEEKNEAPNEAPNEATNEAQNGNGNETQNAGENGQAPAGAEVDIDQLYAELTAKENKAQQEEQEDADLIGMITELNAQREPENESQEAKNPAQEVQNEAPEANTSQEAQNPPQEAQNPPKEAKNPPQEAQNPPQEAQNPQPDSVNAIMDEMLAEMEGGAKPGTAENGQPAAGPVTGIANDQTATGQKPADRIEEERVEEQLAEMEKKIDDEVHELEDQEKKLDQAGEEEQQIKKEMLEARDKAVEENKEDISHLEDEIKAEENGEKPQEVTEEDAERQLAELDKEIDEKNEQERKNRREKRAKKQLENIEEQNVDDNRELKPEEIKADIDALEEQRAEAQEKLNDKKNELAQEGQKEAGKKKDGKAPGDAGKQALNEAQKDLNEVAKQMDQVKKQNFTPVTKERTKVSKWRAFWNRFAGGIAVATRNVGRVISYPITYFMYRNAEKKIKKLGDDLQEKMQTDIIPGWNGQRFETKENEQLSDIIGDTRRVPLVWSKVTTEKPEKADGELKEPEIGLYFEQPKEGSSKSFDLVECGHAFLGIRYSRYSELTGSNQRYDLKFGFYPADGFGTTIKDAITKVSTGSVGPGMLRDDSGHSYTIGRRYPATDKQVYDILKATEGYAAGGYSYYSRNCTTFVKEMVDIADIKTGGTVFEMEELRTNAVINLAQTVGGLGVGFMDAANSNTMAEYAGQNDMTYQNFGNKRVTAEEIRRYRETTDQGRTEAVHMTYTPASSGENLRNINNIMGSHLQSMHYRREEIRRAQSSTVLYNELIHVQNAFDEALNDILTEEMMKKLKPEERTLRYSVLDGSEALSKLIESFDAKYEKSEYAKKKELVTEDRILSEEELRTCGEQLMLFRDKISDLFSNVLMGDRRIYKPAMNLLSVTEQAIAYVDRLYSDVLDRRAGKGTGDLGDLRYRATNQFHKIMNQKNGIHTEMIPTEYEAYLQIYGDVTTAVTKYDRYQELKEKNENGDLSSAERKEYEQLARETDLVTDMVRAHEYMLEKKDFSEQDMDYVFALAQKEKEKGFEGPLLNADHVMSGTYKSVILESIFGGMKNTALKSRDEGGIGDDALIKVGKTQTTLEGEEQIRQWLDDYMTGCLIRKEDAFRRLLRSVKRATKDADAGKIKAAVQTMIDTNYLQIVLIPKGDSKLKLTKKKVNRIVDALMDEGTQFGSRLKTMIDEVINGREPAGEVPKSAEEKKPAEIAGEKPAEKIPEEKKPAEKIPEEKTEEAPAENKAGEIVPKIPEEKPAENTAENKAEEKPEEKPAEGDRELKPEEIKAEINALEEQRKEAQEKLSDKKDELDRTEPQKEEEKGLEKELQEEKPGPAPAEAPGDAGKQALNEAQKDLNEVGKQMDQVKKWDFTPVTKERTKVSKWRGFWNRFAGGIAVATRNLGRVISYPITYFMYRNADKKIAKLGDELQEKRETDLIPGWNGQRFEKKENEQLSDLIRDTRRVPVIWSRITTDNPEKENKELRDPEIGVYFNQPVEGSSSSMKLTDVGHAFLGIRYSRYSPLAGRNVRYDLKYGFYPGGTDDVGVAETLVKGSTGSVGPGQLRNDADHPYQIARTYEATDKQVYDILKKSEGYSAGGYSLYSRNCTTFVKEMLDEANLDTGGNIFDLEEVRMNAIANAGATVGGLGMGFADASNTNAMAELAGQKDMSYQNFGNKKVTAEELKKYRETTDQGRTEVLHMGYTPGASGENLRNIHNVKNSHLQSMHYRQDLRNAGAGCNIFTLSTAIGEAQKAFQDALADLLPKENMPDDVRRGIEQVANGITIMKFMQANYQTKAPVGKQSESQGSVAENRILEEDDYLSGGQMMTEYRDGISALFSDSLLGDRRLYRPAMNLLSIVQIAIDYFDGQYRTLLNSSYGKGKGDLGNLRYRLRHTQGMIMNMEADVNDTMSPSLFESYLQVYGDAATAVKNHKRYTSLQKKEKKETGLTSAEQKEFNTLSEGHRLALDMESAHDYMLENDNFSQQEMDYVFRLTGKEREHGTTGELSIPEGSMSGGYKAIILETIFGGLKDSVQKKKEDGGVGDDILAEMKKNEASEETEREMRQWLDSYLTGCINRKEETFRMVLRAVRHTTPNADSGQIRNAVNGLLKDIYLRFVLVNSNLGMERFKVNRIANELTDEGVTTFGRRLKELIESIMKEA